MTFRQFTALATVAKHMNITKAAQALRISQPSLSKHLKLLEETYNIRLFSRNGNGIRLTDDGLEFLTQIDPIPRKQLNLADLEKIPLIVRANGNQRGPTAVLLQRLAAEGYRPNIVMRCDSPEGIEAAVNNKLGVGILYHEVLKDEIARGVFKEVHVSGLQTQRETYIFYHKERPLSPSAEIFLKLLRQSRDRQVKSATTETDSVRPLPVC